MLGKERMFMDRIIISPEMIALIGQIGYPAVAGRLADAWGSHECLLLSGERVLLNIALRFERGNG